MSALSSALDKLAAESSEIARLSALNNRPAGPFVSAYLYLPSGSSNLFSLVRDASESEKRVFGRLLPSGPSHRNPARARVEPRLSPLRKLSRARDTPHELQATLHAASDVIDAMADSAHSMARARKEVGDFVARHEANVRRVAELERKLQGAMSPARQPTEAGEGDKEEEVVVDVDAAIAAEEEALRALEESLGPMRRRVGEKKAAQRSPRSPRSPNTLRSARHEPSPSPLNRTRPVPSPKSSPLKSSTSSAASRTPNRHLASSSKTPVKLVDVGVDETPRPMETPRSRFDPLHLVATPGARMGLVAGPGSTIVSRMRASITPAPRSAYRSSTLRQSALGRRQPPLFENSPNPTPKPLVEESTTPKAPPRSPARKQPRESTTPKAPPPKEAGRIDADLPAVVTATATIRRTLPPELFRMTGECGDAPADIITHLETVARGDLAPSSPSAPSVTGSLPTTVSTGDAPPPLTKEAILQASLCLSMLRRLGPGAVDAKPNHFAEGEVQSELVAVVHRRGWDGADGLVHNVMYKARGSKLVAKVWKDKTVHFRGE